MNKIKRLVAAAHALLDALDCDRDSDREVAELKDTLESFAATHPTDPQRASFDPLQDEPTQTHMPKRD